MFKVIDYVEKDDAASYVLVEFEVEEFNNIWLPNLPEWYSVGDLLQRMKVLTCTHESASLTGDYHYSGGEVWDDIHLTCDCCGADLDHPDPYLFLHSAHSLL